MIPRMNEVDGWIAELLARQDGVLARRQAVGNGMTVGQIRGRLSSGRWVIVHPGVYRSTDHRVGTASRVRAAGLWAGEHSLLSGLAAAWWWGLTDVEPSTVDIMTSPRRHLRGRPETRIIRRGVASADRAWLRAAPVTGLALSVLTGAVALGAGGPALLDRTLQTRVSLSDLRLAYYRNLGMHGSAAAGHLIRAAADGSAAVSERRFILLLKGAGIRGWRVNYPWTSANDKTTVDIAFVTERLAIEIDGWAWHHSPDRFQRDRAKQNQLVGAGWTVLRFTWFDLTNRPDDVIRQVRAALDIARSAR